MAIREVPKEDITALLVDNVVDFDVERLNRVSLDAKSVPPEQVLALALSDCKREKNVVGCYITMIHDGDDGLSTSNYRGGMSRAEEVAYRQVGVLEAIEGWKVG